MNRDDLRSFDRWSQDIMLRADEHGCNVKINNRGAIITHSDVPELYVKVMHDPRKKIDRMNIQRGLDRLIRNIPKEKNVGTPQPAKPRPVAERCPFCGPLKDGQTISQHNRLHLNADQIEAIDTLTALRELLGVSDEDKDQLAAVEQENIDLRQKLQAAELELNELRSWKQGLQNMLKS